MLAASFATLWLLDAFLVRKTRLANEASKVSQADTNPLSYIAKQLSDMLLKYLLT